MKNNTSLAYSLALIVGDFLALLAAVVAAYILRVSVNHTPTSASVSATTYLDVFLSLLPFWILIFALLGLYNARVHQNRFSELARVLIGSFIGILSVISYSYITNTTIFPARLVTVYGFGLAFFFVLLFRTLARGLRRQLFGFGIGINNILIVGDTRLSKELVDSLGQASVSGYRVLGLVGGVSHAPSSKFGYQLYESFDQAIKKLKAQQMHTIIQTELYAANDKNDAILNYAQSNHIDYRFVPGNSELFVGNIDVELFRSIPVIAVNQTALIGWGRVVKRVFDVLAGSLALLLSLPFMAVIIVALKISEPRGDIFYRQVRLTRFNQEFTVYKFRTPKSAYNKLSPEKAFAKMGKPELAKDYRANGDFLPNDPRFGRLGMFLRKASLDELPQLFNVLRGELSLVGPRALVPQELSIYEKRHTILAVKSGLTGLAQISGRRNISFEERRKLDIYYVQNWSFANDLVILIKTIWVVLFHKGAA